MYAIEVNRLTKYYGNKVGVEDVSFAVESGEIFGFLGPNGAGKTTTIRLLMDLLRPDSGGISLFEDRLKPNAVNFKDRVGYLPGDFLPYNDMSGQEFLNYMAKYRSRQPELRDLLLEKLNFTPTELSQKIKHLSHGTRQKLGIILTFEHNPDLAILDEPTSGLDPLVQEAFYEFLLEFQQNNKTIFLSSHILPEVEKVCHRVAIIRDGKIVALEQIEKLKAKRPRRLIVVFSEIMDNNIPALHEAQWIYREGNRHHYLVKGHVHEIIKALCDLPVEDVVFPEPDLEDVFLTYYARSEK